MPVATLISEKRQSRSFLVNVCPIHVEYQGKLWSRQQGGNWDKDSTYRQSGVLVLDDTMRTDTALQQHESSG
jgi:hypothetical protein